MTRPRCDGRGWENDILSYQLVLDCEGRRSSLLVTTTGRTPDHRVRLGSLLKRLFGQAIREGVLSRMPPQVTIFGHFIRGDATALADFAVLRSGFRGLARTLVTGPAGHSVEVEGSDQELSNAVDTLYVENVDRTRHRVQVRFLDTQKLIPGGGGLDVAAAMVGRRKLDLHSDLHVPNATAPEFSELEGLGVAPVYGKARMDLVQRDFPEAFTAYAMADAEIALDVGQLSKRIASEELGIAGLPASVASMAARLLTKHSGGPDRLAALLGREKVTRTHFNEQTRRYRTVKSLEASLAARLWERLGMEAYHGGRNECFYHGPSPVGRWFDYDLPSAYTTILGGIQPLDYARARQVADARDFQIDDVGAAWIIFSYPPDTRFPGLPVRSESNALFFPLIGRRSDRVVVTPPEIVVALAAGADIEVIQGVVIPPARDERIFESFIRMVNQKRTAHPRNMEPVKHAYYKEIGNSVYGLTAQGLREKRAFDPATGKSVPLKPSSLTEPFVAALASGYTRAVLAEMPHGMPAAATVISVTTDGFLTDAPVHALRLDGPACSHFAALRQRLFGQGDLLALKHGAKQLVSVATRATYTARRLSGPVEPSLFNSRLTGSRELAPVLAKGGIKLDLKPNIHNAAMLRLYLGQCFGKTITHEELISAREQLTRERDLYSIAKTRRLNLAYDFKRRPDSPAMVALSPRLERIAWDSLPWETVTAAEQARARAKAWMRAGERLILDMDAFRDWEAFEEAGSAMLEASEAADRRPLPIRQDGAAGVLKRWFLQAGRSGLHGLAFPSKGLTALASLLTNAGIPTTKDDLTYASRRKTALLLHSVPLVPATRSMLHAILQGFPGFAWRDAFRPRDHAAIAADLENKTPSSV